MNVSDIKKNSYVVLAAEAEAETLELEGLGASFFNSSGTLQSEDLPAPTVIYGAISGRSN
jgi:hypothetical protein